MATQLTPNRLLRYDDLPDSADAKRLGQNLATDLDNVANIYFGTLAARPVATAAAGHGAGNPGSFYWGTDTAELFVSVAGNWVKVTTEPGVPLGGLLDYAGASDPSDSRWLLADGREISRVGPYAPLFVVIGTTYGVGNGTTTFNIPDLRGRVSVGLDNMGTAKGDAARLTANDARGQASGAETKTLSFSEMPAKMLRNTGATSVQLKQPGTTGTPNVVGVDAVDQAAAVATAYNQMQPYLVLNKLIRVR